MEHLKVQKENTKMHEALKTLIKKHLLFVQIVKH